MGIQGHARGAKGTERRRAAMRKRRPISLPDDVKRLRGQRFTSGATCRRAKQLPCFRSSLTLLACYCQAELSPGSFLLFCLPALAPCPCPSLLRFAINSWRWLFSPAPPSVPPTPSAAASPGACRRPRGTPPRSRGTPPWPPRRARPPEIGIKRVGKCERRIGTAQ